MSKKHLNFGQGLEFLKFGQGNRGLNQQNQRKSKDTARNSKGKQRNADQKIRDRDPYFLLNNFLFDIFSVWQLLVIFECGRDVQSSYEIAKIMMIIFIVSLQASTIRIMEIHSYQSTDN